MCSTRAFGKTQNLLIFEIFKLCIILKYEMVNGLGSSQEDHQGLFDRILLVPSSVVGIFSSSNEIFNSIFNRIMMLILQNN